MPSKALSKFETVMLKDVDRMIATHERIQGGARGNNGLGHLTRAGVLLLCAAWELYIEELLLEAIEVSIKRCKLPDDLPDVVKLAISTHVKESKHHYKPLAMAGDGWKAVYRELGQGWVGGLNTPKKANVDSGFATHLGLKDLSNSWSLGDAAIDDFVTVRGAVAHRGSDAGTILMNRLKGTFRPEVCQCAVETDNAVSTYIRNTYSPHKYPWNRRTI